MSVGRDRRGARRAPSRRSRSASRGIVLGAIAWVITIPPIEVRGMVPSIVLAVLAVLRRRVVDRRRRAQARIRGDRRRPVRGRRRCRIGELGDRDARVRVHLVGARRGDAPLRDAAAVRGARRRDLRAQRRDQHRPRRHDADGLLLGHLRRRPAGLLGAGAWSSRWSPAGCWRSLHAFFSIHLRANQIVSGIGINFLALGITGYFLEYHYGHNGTPLNISMVPNVKIPLIQHVGFFGAAFGDANLMTWVGIALVPALTFFLFRTRGGLRLRSVGEKPRAADTVGLSVMRIRYVAGHRVRHARGARRRLPLGRLRRVVQQRHDQRSRLHRAGGDDLRQVEALGRAVGVPAVRIRKRHVRPGLQRQSRRSGRCSRRCPTF